MFFLGTIVGAFVAVLLGLVTLEIPGVQVAFCQGWLSIAYAPPVPSAPSVVYGSVDYANDFFLLSRSNFTALASPSFLDSTTSPPEFEITETSFSATAGFFDKMLGILSWFLVAIVKNGLAFLPVAYAISRSRKDQRIKAFGTLASSREALLLEVQRWEARGMQFLVEIQTASKEKTLKDNCIAQLTQVTSDLEKDFQDNLRRFEESKAENESLGLTVQKLEADLLSQEEAAKVATAAMESVHEELNSQIQDKSGEVEALVRRIKELEEGGRKEEEKSRQLEVEKEAEMEEKRRMKEELNVVRGEKGRVEKELKVERREKGKVEEELKMKRGEKGRVEEKLEAERGEKRRVEVELEVMRGEKEMAEEEMKEAKEETERVAGKRKEAEKELEEVLEAAAGKVEEEKAKAKKAEEAREAAVKEMEEMKKSLILKEAAFQAQRNHAQMNYQRVAYGSARPGQPQPPVQNQGQWPQQSVGWSPPPAAWPQAPPPGNQPPPGPRQPPPGPRQPPPGPRQPPPGLQ